MSKDLQAAIRHLAETFAQGVLDAVRASSLEEIRNNADGGARRRGRPPRGAAAATSVEPAPAPARAKRGRAAKGQEEGTDVSVDRIVYLVRKSPKGLRSEELRARLNLEKIAFRQAAAKAVAANLIRKTGEKRSTTFFPK
ncbi:hypothetical protein [Pendulispora albinea]|uniref:Uncharacterized protein n=1 Tax=Pendulispora albinea TaxID=2741071 RepID=A0ABZ2M694_9BACT